jgi:hypothetical protein
MGKRDTPETQSDKFKEAARDLEADESEETFDEKLRRFARRPLTKDSNTDSKK